MLDKSGPIGEDRQSIFYRFEINHLIKIYAADVMADMRCA